MLYFSVTDLKRLFNSQAELSTSKFLSGQYSEIINWWLAVTTLPYLGNTSLW